MYVCDYCYSNRIALSHGIPWFPLSRFPPAECALRARILMWLDMCARSRVHGISHPPPLSSRNKERWQHRIRCIQTNYRCANSRIFYTYIYIYIYIYIYVLEYMSADLTQQPVLVESEY